MPSAMYLIQPLVYSSFQGQRLAAVGRYLTMRYTSDSMSNTPPEERAEIVENL